MYLVGVVPAEDTDQLAGFQTEMMSMEEIMRLREKLRLSGETTSDSFVYEVKKRALNAWMDWISIGRAPNNDIVLKHSTVSKLHARIKSTEEGEAKRYWIADSGSHTGTKINSVRMEPKIEYELFNGDRINIGGVECYFVEHPFSNKDPR